MNVVTLEDGSKGFDTVSRISHNDALNLFVSGFKFAVRYVTSLTVGEIQDILSANLALSFVSYANSFDPVDELAALAKLKIPPGVVVWLDVEGFKGDPIELQKRINMWAHALKAAGYIPGLYVGAGCPLTSAELYALAVERYWKSCSRVVDSHNNVAEPLCGWAMTQCTCNVQRAKVLVDVDFAYRDYKGRGVTMVSL